MKWYSEKIKLKFLIQNNPFPDFGLKNSGKIDPNFNDFDFGSGRILSGCSLNS